ncbi:uncharacterized protein EI97DRAFT_449591 [Westerdykella ornata]|uniref:Nitrogen regulatory protein areA GATA-like domain-containing protein n=1 Tax=Westerdykella ornata TaxID=318751 RepID=A0A6A6JMN3_WESOR|nr:uncharacterized protein EI97DRAFT_449591 [Westerdykella ornata]KAF2277485.1 hypothetical protein EI97DRAFT_449591 [Westerdykella ornata]
MMGEVASLRSSASHTSFFDSSASFDRRTRKKSSSHSDLATSNSSFSLHVDSDSDDSEDDGLLFPEYSKGTQSRKDIDNVPPSSPVGANITPSSPVETADSNSPVGALPDPPLHFEDDTAVKVEPSHHVDYLTYEWREEKDLWSSWRHIVEHRKVYGERSRLENASWRTWAKNQFKLKTVSPETLDWAKELDVAWLYGPLQPASNRSVSLNPSEPTSRISKTNSFVQKKPILKKRSMSEVMLQNSISASSLVKQAAAAVQAQQRAGGTPLEPRRPRPILAQTPSDYFTSAIPSRTASRDPPDYFSSRSTSGLHTPECGERKHIRFDEKVEQCIAVECKGTDDDDYDEDWAANDHSSDEDMVMMKTARRRRPRPRKPSRTASAAETKIIEKLPATTLKSQTDSPEVSEHHLSHSLFGVYRSARLSPSPSQETLRPSNPSTNFLLPNEEDDEEEDWRSARAYEVKRPGTPTPHKMYASSLMNASNPDSSQAESSSSGGLKRTASGVMTPFQGGRDDDVEGAVPPGILGKVVDTVNTARDIAHVIWNVSWRG